ncbi:TraM recognition domain-containing protein [Xylanimonas ulmi]|uniref:TraM-binding TraD/TraG-like protein n=1 Tax=Xylanimonas ulmi TaxID=228973 RepID=A0A4Q7LZL9_9MICO|nr:TraM recognition domain-containing protein [Xylanibacterium ulmi]RZS60023.1 TraM-binding TraD/TraG-like protein [Xylanibacterium ulmi]
MDGLSLYFRAMRHLPVSEIRRLAINEDASLRAMGGSERTISSVYGIALAAMNYFSDPTVMMLTSGPPSETVDIASLSFPRRLAVRLDPAYVRNRAMGGSQVRWSAYADPLFSEPLGGRVTFECADARCAAKTGKVTGAWPDDGLCPTCQAAMVDLVTPDPEFSHTDTLTQNGWAYFYLRGMFPADTTYVLLEAVSQTAGTTVETMRFRFDKGYRHADRGRTIVTKPLTGERIVRDGLLTEIAVGGQPRTSVYDQELVAKRDGQAHLEEVATPIVRSTSVRYSQSPKALFMITPPHLDKYARLLLVLLRDMVDLNFEAAYMTRTNQQPDLGTKFMLDEIGNLKSEGNGLRGFETLLSIGLGQRQQFHLILQSLQQLTEIYGGSVESILQSNTANLIFLKSTDTELIERLSKMSGQRHVAYRGSKTVTKDMEDLLQFKSVEGRVSYTMALDTENVILANDLTFLPARNWVVLRSGEYPIWNRDETIMPMAYALLDKQPPVGAPTFSLQNLPSLSNAGAYDPRKDTPNFESALQRICAQALASTQSKAEYQQVAGIDEDEITYMEPDFYAEQVMSLIQANVVGRPSLDETIALLREEFAPWVIGATAQGSTSTASAAGGAASERIMGDSGSGEAAAGAASGQTADKPRGGPALIVDDDEGFPLDFDDYDEPGA